MAHLARVACCVIWLVALAPRASASADSLRGTAQTLKSTAVSAVREVFRNLAEIPPPAPTPPDASPLPDSCCPGNFTGLRAYNKCTQFFQCVDGKVKGPTRCRNYRQWFNEGTGRCEFDETLQCGEEPCAPIDPTPAPTRSTEAPTPAPTESTTTQTTTTQTQTFGLDTLGDLAHRRCAILYPTFRMFCGITREGHCVLNVYTGSYSQSRLGSCSVWCQSQGGRECIRGVDNAGSTHANCDMKGPNDDNRDRDPCDYKLLDQICTCGDA